MGLMDLTELEMVSNSIKRKTDQFTTMLLLIKSKDKYYLNNFGYDFGLDLRFNSLIA